MYIDFIIIHINKLNSQNLQTTFYVNTFEKFNILILMSSKN